MSVCVCLCVCHCTCIELGCWNKCTVEFTNNREELLRVVKDRVRGKINKGGDIRVPRRERYRGQSKITSVDEISPRGVI